MHPLRGQALSALTLVGDLCIPVATQPSILLLGRRLFIIIIWQLQWNFSGYRGELYGEGGGIFFPPSPALLRNQEAQPEELALVGNGMTRQNQVLCTPLSSNGCNIICDHAKHIETASRTGFFPSLTQHEDMPFSLITVACNLGLQVLTQVESEPR